MTDNMPNSPIDPAEASRIKFYKFLGNIIPESRSGAIAALAASVSVLIGTISIIPAITSAYIAKYQLDTAMHQLYATDRPWIKINDINIKSINVSKYSLSFYFETAIENIGKSSALNVEVFSKVLVSDVYVTDKKIDDVCKKSKSFDDVTQNALMPEEEFHGGSPVSRINKKEPSEASPNSSGMIASEESGELYRYVPYFDLVVCVSYNIYKDPIKHYTASTFYISKKVDTSKDTSTSNKKEKTLFDVFEIKDYKKSDLTVVKERILSRAN